MTRVREGLRWFAVSILIVLATGCWYATPAVLAGTCTVVLGLITLGWLVWSGQAATESISFKVAGMRFEARLVGNTCHPSVAAAAANLAVDAAKFVLSTGTCPTVPFPVLMDRLLNSAAGSPLSPTQPGVPQAPLPLAPATTASPQLSQSAVNRQEVTDLSVCSYCGCKPATHVVECELNDMGTGTHTAEYPACEACAKAAAFGKVRVLHASESLSTCCA